MGAAWAADVSVAAQPGRAGERLEVDLCSADRCDRLASVSPVEASNYLYLPHIDPETVEGPLTVVATLRGQDGATLSTSSASTDFETLSPNGAGCGSVSVLASVALAL